MKAQKKIFSRDFPKNFVLVSLAFLSFNTAKAQTKPGKAVVSADPAMRYIGEKDTIALRRFLTEFADAIRLDNQEKMINLISFPVYYSQPGPLTSPQDEKTPVKTFSKKKFSKSYSTLIRRDAILHFVNDTSLYRENLVFESFNDWRSGELCYIIGIPGRKNYWGFRDDQLLFDLVKRKNAFKIKHIYKQPW